MTYTTSLTQKGQVTIPHEIRKHLGLKPLDRVVFTKSKGDIIIRPAKDFLNLMGSVKNKVKYSDKDADIKLARELSREYEKTSRS